MIVKAPISSASSLVIPSAESSAEIAIPSAEKPKQAVVLIEAPIATPAERQRNYDAVRNGFLDIDSEGRCNTGCICREAFDELRSKCGDPATWLAEDMQRPEINDLVIAYRTFGILHDNKALIP